MAVLASPVLAVNEGFLTAPEEHLDRALNKAIELKDVNLITTAASVAVTVLGERSLPLIKKATDGLAGCPIEPRQFDLLVAFISNCSSVSSTLRDRNLAFAVEVASQIGPKSKNPKIFLLREELFRLLINDHDPEPSTETIKVLQTLFKQEHFLQQDPELGYTDSSPERFASDLMVLSPRHYLACFRNIGTFQEQQAYLIQATRQSPYEHFYLRELSRRGWASKRDAERLSELWQVNEIRNSHNFTPRVPPAKAKSWEERANWLANFYFPVLKIPVRPADFADLIVFRPKESEALIQTLSAKDQAECRFYAGAGIAATNWQEGLRIMRESKWKPAYIQNEYGEEYIPATYGIFMLAISPDKTERVKGTDRQIALEQASALGFLRTGSLDVMRQIIANLTSQEEIDRILAYVSNNLACHSYGVMVEPLLDEIRDTRRSAQARCNFVGSVWRRAIPP